MKTRQPSGPTMEFQVHFKSGRRGAKQLRKGRGPARGPEASGEGRVPRVTKIMALAIRLDHLVRAGHIKDYAEIARLGHVTRARVSQIMDFNLLAPDIQEALLDLPRVLRGRDPVTERDLRAILKMVNWGKQRKIWAVNTASNS